MEPDQRRLESLLRRTGHDVLYKPGPWTECLVIRHPGGAKEEQWLGHGSTPAKALRNAWETMCPSTFAQDLTYEALRQSVDKPRAENKMPRGGLEGRCETPETIPTAARDLDMGRDAGSAGQPVSIDPPPPPAQLTLTGPLSEDPGQRAIEARARVLLKIIVDHQGDTGMTMSEILHLGQADCQVSAALQRVSPKLENLGHVLRRIHDADRIVDGLRLTKAGKHPTKHTVIWKVVRETEVESAPNRSPATLVEALEPSPAPALERAPSPRTVIETNVNPRVGILERESQTAPLSVPLRTLNPNLAALAETMPLGPTLPVIPVTAPLRRSSTGPRRASVDLFRRAMATITAVQGEIRDETEPLGVMATSRMRLACSLWIARVRDAQEIGRHPDVDKAAKEVLDAIQLVSKRYWTGALLGLKLGISPAAALREWFPVDGPASWREGAEHLLRLAEIPLVDRGWRDRDLIGASVPDPQGTLQQALRLIEAVIGSVKTLPDHRRTDISETQRTQLCHAGRMLRWIRRATTEPLNWARAFGALRWAAWRTDDPRLLAVADDQALPKIPWSELVKQRIHVAPEPVAAAAAVALPASESAPESAPESESSPASDSDQGETTARNLRGIKAAFGMVPRGHLPRWLARTMLILTNPEILPILRTRADEILAITPEDLLGPDGGAPPRTMVLRMRNLLADLQATESKTDSQPDNTEATGGGEPEPTEETDDAEDLDPMEGVARPIREALGSDRVFVIAPTGSRSRFVQERLRRLLPGHIEFGEDGGVKARQNARIVEQVPNYAYVLMPALSQHLMSQVGKKHKGRVIRIHRVSVDNIIEALAERLRSERRLSTENE